MTKKDIKFYGKIVEYSSGEPMVAELQSLLADKYNIESLQVDWGNLDTVIRTGIASNSPADVYQYWPQNMRPLIDSNMALDLTPYLEANGGEWKNSFYESALNTGKFDGKYYGIPINSNFSLMIANKDLLDANGITIPENWNWDQFVDVCKQLKDKDIFPMGLNTDNQQGDWFFRNGILSLSASAGNLEQMASAEIPATDALFEKVFTNVKGLYDNQYMYPGKGAVTVKRDEIKAGFYQGKIAIIADIASGVGGTIEEAPFNTVLIPWPSMGATNAILGGCDGLFIPSNVADPDAAVEVLKTYTSVPVQQIHANAGFPIANKLVEVNDPTTKAVVELSSAVYPFEFANMDARLKDYLGNQALAEVVLGQGVAAAQEALEQIRAGISR